MINRPNILMIMTDNQPADMLGCYGNDEVLTPHHREGCDRGPEVNGRRHRAGHSTLTFDDRNERDPAVTTELGERGVTVR